MPRIVDADRRREEIARAVADIAVDQGFGAVTVRAVASRLGASTSTVTHYFSHRDELVGFALRDALDRFREGLAAAVGTDVGPSAVRRFVEYAVFGEPAPSRRVWMRAVVDAPGDAVVRRELARFDRSWDETLDRLAWAISDSAGDAERLVAQLDVVISGAVIVGVEGVPDDQRHSAVASLLELVLGSPRS